MTSKGAKQPGPRKRRPLSAIPPERTKHAMIGGRYHVGHDVWTIDRIEDGRCHGTIGWHGVFDYPLSRWPPNDYRRRI